MDTVLSVLGEQPDAWALTPEAANDIRKHLWYAANLTNDKKVPYGTPQPSETWTP